MAWGCGESNENYITMHAIKAVPQSVHTDDHMVMVSTREKIYQIHSL